MSTGEHIGWLNKLAPAIGVVAGAMVVAGVYLLDPGVVDLGFALDAARTWLVGAFLIYAAAVLMFRLVRPGDVSTGSVIVDLFLNLLVGEIAHFATGGIATAIGGQALFATPPNFWAAALLVPGLLSLAIALSDDAKENTASDEATDATTPDSGQVNVGATSLFALIYGVTIAVYMFGAFVWLALVFFLYYSLEAVVLEGATFDAASAGAALWAVVLKILPTAAPLAIIVAVMVAAITFIAMLFQWLSRSGATDGNRDLNAAETAYVDASAEAVSAYAKAQGYDRNVWLMQAIGLASVLGAIGIGAVVMFAALAMIDPTPTHASFPIELKRGGFSAIVGLFAFIMFSVVPHSILSRLSRRYSERSGWVSIGVKNDYFTLKGKLTSFVRARRLSTATPINPSEFVRAANVSFEWYFIAPGIVIAAIALLLFQRDLEAVHTITADHIEITNYWTLERERFSYGDVQQVEVRCFITDKGETAEAYELSFKNGQTLDIHRGKTFTPQFEAYEAVDTKLRALGVAFVPGAHSAWFKSDERGYAAECVEKVAKGFPEQLRDRVRRFFHLDELKAVKEIWPWNADLANAKIAADKYEVEKAVALYTKAIASGRLSAHLLAVAYFGRGDARDSYETAYGMRDSEMLLALHDYQKARDIEPSSRVYDKEAATFSALGAYDDATAAYRKALELDKPPHWSLIGLARVERIQGRYDAALQHLDEVLRARGEDGGTMPIYYHRARVLYLKNDNAGVVDAITKGLVYQPDYASAFNRRACAYARLGDFAKAKDDMAQTIKLARAPPLDEAWEKTPYAKAYYAEIERDRATIDAMTAGTASDADPATLCQDTWNYGEDLRTRSPLLPPRG